MEKDGVVRKKAKNPCTGRSIHAERCKRSNHDPGLNMIKEAGEVKEEDAADTSSTLERGLILAIIVAAFIVV